MTPLGGGVDEGDAAVLVAAAAAAATAVPVVSSEGVAAGLEVGAEPLGRVRGDGLTPPRLGETRCVGAARLVVLPALELWLPATLLLLLLRVDPTSRLKRWFMEEDIGRSLSWEAASCARLQEIKPEGAGGVAPQNRQAGRQTGRQAGRQADRQTGRQTRGEGGSSVSA